MELSPQQVEISLYLDLLRDRRDQFTSQSTGTNLSQAYVAAKVACELSQVITELHLVLTGESTCTNLKP